LQAGKDVIDAIDAGGLPLDPARINRIARELGLEVSPGAGGRHRRAPAAAVGRGLENLAMQDAANKKKGGKK
jgi:hypothetical protein